VEGLQDVLAALHTCQATPAGDRRAGLGL